MATRSEVASLVAGLFGDGGATVLSEADLGSSWEEVLANLPPTVFQAAPAGPHPPGELWLARLRDHWARTGQLRQAIAATRGLIRRRVARLGREHPDTLLELGAMGALADRAGRHEDARQLLEEAWQGLRSAAGGRDLRVAVVAEHAGAHYLRSDNLHEAELAFEQAYRIRQQSAPGTQAGPAGLLGDVWVRRGRHQQAVPLLQEAYDLTRERYGSLHGRTLARARALASALAELDRHDEAEPVLRDLHADAVKSGDRERIAETAFQLGIGLYRLKQVEEGYRTIDESIKLTRQLGDPHPSLANRLSIWSRLLRSRGHIDEAEGVLKEAIEAEGMIYGTDSPQVAARYMELAELLDVLGRSSEAIGWVDPAYNLFLGELGPDHPATRRAATAMADLLYKRVMKVLSYEDKKTARELQEYGRSLLPVLGPKDVTLRTLLDLDI